MIVASLVLAGIVWLIVVGVERTSRAPIAAGFAGLGVSIVMMFFLMFGSLSLFLTGVFMVLAGIVCRLCKFEGWKFAGTTFATLPLAVMCVAIGSWDRLEETRELQTKYGFQSLDGRLAYEATATKARTENEATAVQVSAETAEFIDEVDMRAEVDARWRPALLQQLHERQLTAFSNSPGFGVTRGVRFYSEEQIRTEPRPAITPPEAPEVPYEPSTPDRLPHDVVQISGGSESYDIVAASNDAELAIAQAATPDVATLKGLHRQSAIDFVNPLGFGLVESRTRVAGFESHAFSKLPELFRPLEENREYEYDHQTKPEPDLDWVLVSLQLVSMLKHETPVIYATNELPRMEALRSDDIPTRPLDAFEATALPKVKEGEMLVVEQGINRIRMLGAVRAGNKCMECHSVPRNTLLGAFSYELVRQQPVPETQAVVEGPEL